MLEMHHSLDSFTCDLLKDKMDYPILIISRYLGYKILSMCLCVAMLTLCLQKSKEEGKHHIQESQEVSTFPAGNHKVAMKRQDSMTDMKHK